MHINLPLDMYVWADMVQQKLSVDCVGLILLMTALPLHPSGCFCQRWSGLCCLQQGSANDRHLSKQDDSQV